MSRFLKPSTRRNGYGVSKVKRDSYSNEKQDWWSIRNEVFLRDGKKCQARILGKICGKPGVDVHHIVALGRGGTTTKSNLITVCKDCHDKRHPGH